MKRTGRACTVTWEFVTLLLGGFVCRSYAGDSPPIAEPSGTYETVAVFYDNLTASYSVVNGSTVGSNGWVAWANFSNQISSNGWSFLKVVTNASYPDGVQAYAAGLAEGHLTTNLLYYHWMNTVDINCRDSDEQSSRSSTPSYCSRLSHFLNENLQWMREQIVQNVAEDSYWHQVDLTLKQIQGLQDGCQSSFLKSLDEPVIQEYGFLMFHIAGDLSTFDQIWNRTFTGNDGVPPGSCSAIVKLLPGNQDLYVSHGSWSSYSEMTRILKKYELNYHQTSKPGSPLIPGNKVSFSSYPGLVHSLDDYHLISSGLLSMETTIEVYNKELWSKIQPRSLLSFARTVVANRLATDGESWTNYFADHNSGTYNNQWMIVDYNKFTASEKHLKDGLLWVLEQLPGTVSARDQTDTLRHKSYWASYNIPYYPEIDKLSGNLEKFETFGDFFSFTDSSRGLMFRKYHTNVTDVDTLFKLMRYNDFENDPLSESNCTITQNALSAIAGRGDLVEIGTDCPIKVEEHSLYGSYDTKITNAEMFAKREFVAWGGPTYDQQPPFQWSKQIEADTSNKPHMGQPDLWQFGPVRVTWE